LYCDLKIKEDFFSKKEEEQIEYLLNSLNEIDKLATTLKIDYPKNASISDTTKKFVDEELSKLLDRKKFYESKLENITDEDADFISVYVIYPFVNGIYPSDFEEKTNLKLPYKNITDCEILNILKETKTIPIETPKKKEKELDFWEKYRVYLIGAGVVGGLFVLAKLFSNKKDYYPRTEYILL